jgi:hypothetical protein
VAEIDSGNPVMILVEGHAMVGIGYNTDGQIVYLHDTWDCYDHTMTWGGTYADMAHYAVAVVHLAPQICCPEPSPCIDAGPEDPDFDALFFGMYRHTTRIDGKLDTGPLDIGYHFLLSMDALGGCDYNFDDIVDLSDLEIWQSHNGDVGCGFPEWCNGTDLNKDGTVNLVDYAIFAGHYKLTDTTAPKPNPMTWAVAPRSAGATSISMTATKAYDNSTGSSVEYYFEASGGGHSSGWQTDSSYTDTNIMVAPGTTCGYRVKARDTSISQNETGWSVVGYAVVGIPLEPSYLTATAVSSSQINLSWIDKSNNETGFKIERKTGVAGFSQIAEVGANTDSYSDSDGVAGLTPQTTYTYRVRAFNSVGASNYTNEASATTLEEGPPPDTAPPLPNPSRWAVEPYEYGQRDPNTGMFWYYHRMQAVQADDSTTGGNCPCEYYFDCVSGSGGQDSGWQLSPIYICRVGIGPTTCQYKVRTRDAVGNTTEWSSIKSTYPLP